MKTMHVARMGLVVLGTAVLLAAAPAYAQNEAPALQARPSPGTVDAAGGPGATVKQAVPAQAGSGAIEDIRDIRGPREIPDAWFWALYAAGGVLALLLLYGAWRVLARKKLRVKLAHERAFEALEQARTLMQPEKVREFCFRLSDVVRQYIEERFSVQTTQQTTSEFLLYMSEQNAGPLSDQRGLLDEFLKNCDLVKFARWGMTESEMEAMFQSAWQFVDATKPVSDDRGPVSVDGRGSRTPETGNQKPDPEGSPKAGVRSSGSGARRWAGGPDTGNRTPVTVVGGVS